MTADRHDEHSQNTAAYLLGALNDLERQAFERHLAHCQECRTEIEQLRPALEALPRSVTPDAPPASLKASIMETVEREARTRAGTGGAPSRRRTPFGRLRPAVAWAGVAAVLAIGVVAGAGISALTDDGATGRTVVASVDAARAPGAAADLAIASDRSSAILRVRGMPRLPDDRVYQVGVQRGGALEPDALFRVDRDGRGTTAVDRSLDGADAVMVTREPAAGSAAPSEEPVIVVPT